MNSEREIKEHGYSVYILSESALASKNILDGLVKCEKNFPQYLQAFIAR